MSDSPRLLDWWLEVVGDVPDANEVWTDLITRYSEPHRGYHDLTHLMFVLRYLREQGAERETLLAAWFHDAVYDPTSKLNEVHSAELAEQQLQRLGLGELAPRVGALIATTAGHASSDDAQVALLHDADLLILAQPAPIYLRYVDGVRREYQHLSDAEFRSGRAQILEDFLQRERIYSAPHLAEQDAEARRNITAELSLYGRSPAADAPDEAAGPSDGAGPQR